MTLLVAFLRGVNVGGHTIKKEQLQEVFRSLSLQNAVTYKQSGNVIFETNSQQIDEVKAEIESKLREIFGYDITVIVRTIHQLKAVVCLNAFAGQETEGASFLITMLPCSTATFPLELPLTIPKSTARIISLMGTNVFSVTHGGGEGALPNSFIELKLNLKATTRNLNTIKEIVKMYGGDNV